jgi:3',5'-cyclic AMP phosphodiesterase CpdA
MRIVHLTDLHYHEPVGLRQALGKRAIGLGNLDFRGRAKRFGGPARRALVEDVLAQQPGLAVITGDLTALATPAEFARAHEVLEPLLRAVPTVLLAGNHDRYTLGSFRTRRMERTFGRWMEGGGWDATRGEWDPGDVSMQPARFDLGGVTVLTLDTARPDLVHRGRVDSDHLARLESTLASGELAGRFVILALHYPLLDREGQPYVERTHLLRGVHAVIELLRRHPVHAVLHGHAHHWFTTALETAVGDSLPVFNCGSSGLAPGEGRGPGYFVFDVQGDRLADACRRTWTDDGYRDRPLDD